MVEAGGVDRGKGRYSKTAGAGERQIRRFRFEARRGAPCPPLRNSLILEGA